MKILVINAGSSSVKYQLFDMTNEKVMAKGLCDRIGIPGGNFKHTVPEKDLTYKKEIQIENHSHAIRLIVDALVNKEHGVIASMSEIDAVGHRVLHGGEKFSGSVLVDDNVVEAVKECSELGPLHNPHNLTGIFACEEIMGKIPQVAVFDTGFHQTMPDYAYLYALPYEYYEKYKIRRYGFHGTSHRYVSMRTAQLLGKDPKDLKIVTCHLGNGSSVAAVDGGKCLDTSMGLTPLEGIMMGTRCGSIDPAIIPLLMQKEGLDAKQIDEVMNKKSGILGITGGVTSDNRVIEKGAAEGNKRYQLIENMLCHQLVKLIGGYAAAMGGVDAVVFTGGIGENNPHYRTRIADKLAFLGAEIDEEKNNTRGVEVDLSQNPEQTKLHLMVVPTNEELMIAKDTMEIVSGK